MVTKSDEKSATERRDALNLKERRESACKPGSVEGNHSSGIASPAPQATYPEAARGHTLQRGDFPIWPCSRWGLPCRRCCHRRGALLPHLFTLTGALLQLRRFAFCCTFRRLAPPRRYLAPCPRSPDFPPISRELQRLPGRLPRLVSHGRYVRSSLYSSLREMPVSVDVSCRAFEGSSSAASVA